MRVCRRTWILSGGSGVRFSASGFECSLGRGRHVAVYADGRVWAYAQWMVSMSDSIPRSLRRPMRGT